VRALLKELMDEGVDGIVIDLRHNGGGSLSEATELTGLFIEQGPVVQVKDSSGKLDLEQDPDPHVVYEGPLAVLVDRHSASASEIFAGAIQDYGRGLVIGEPTFGKGTVQTLIDLDRFVRGDDDLGRLRLTMAQFYRVNGESTQFRGVVPDVLFPFAASSDEQGERSLDNALPWDHIKAARFEPYGLGTLADLDQRHRKRIEDDPGFRYLVQEYALAKEIREQKTISLNEARRRAEWDRREKARRDNENAFRALVGLELLPENPDPEADDEDEEADEAISAIQATEAARILADYIRLNRPLSAMAK
jgi:carboxyl-terminal processing protease